MIKAVFNRSFDFCADIIACSKNCFIGIFSFNLTSMEDLRYLRGDQEGLLKEYNMPSESLSLTQEGIFLALERGSVLNSEKF